MNVQWYPGHMTKAKRQMQEDLKLINLIIELVDARVPLSSRNPDIDQLGQNKSRLILLNKADLADERQNEAWKEYFQKRGFHVVKVDSRNGSGMKTIQNVIQEACKEKIERDRRRGIKNRPIRAMVAGIPNVGKSTFLSRVTNAQPKIANYHFTTLNPNLGVVDLDGGKGFVIADIPGLIEGASEGAGLGHQFLRHLSRTSLLLHVIDVAPLDTEEDPIAAARAIVEELRKFDPALADKPRWVVLNKMDLVPEEERANVVDKYREAFGTDVPMFAISAVTREGTEALVKAIAEDIHEQRRQLIKESEPDVRFDEDEEVFPPEGGEPEEGEQK